MRPNEISLEKPFIERHIQATRSAYGIDSRTREIEFQAKPEAPIDVAKHKLLLDNVRLWDWKAFRDTLSQIQPLRPYVYSDVDVDRYTMHGQLRQVLLSPRELDLNGLGDARSRWINPHFIYTHGYGIVMAEANQITTNGLPVLFVKDAPPEITVPGLEADAPRAVLRRDRARSGVRAHRAAGIQLSGRRAQRADPLRRQGRLSDLVVSDADRGRRLARRLEHPADQLSHARRAA